MIPGLAGPKTPMRSVLALAVFGVCLAQAQTPGAARLESMTGQISVLRDNLPWAMKVGDEVRPRQTLVTGPDGFAVFKLPDGSRFEVFPDSRVVFRSNQGSWSDLLDLYIGRVKVFIQKLGNQPNHNRVTTPTAVISVRGTVFDVAIEDQDYTTLVSVDEGAVLVRHLLQTGERLLGPGEWIRVFKNQPLARTLDKGGVVQRAMRAAAEAMYEAVYRTSRPTTTAGGTTVPGPGGGGGAPLPGDRDGGEPPPPPPPPPPAP